LNLVLKADVLGSLEVLENTIMSLPQNEARLNILEKAVGEINLNDAKIAKSADAVIIGFRVKTAPDVQGLALREKIRIVNFDIIYELIEWLRKFMERAKTTQIVRKDIGRLKVLLSFWAKNSRQIIGGKIIEGEVHRGVKIEVIRNEKVIGQGRLINLQKIKKMLTGLLKERRSAFCMKVQKNNGRRQYHIFCSRKKLLVF